MTFWDIAAGILIAAFCITAIAMGLRSRGERALGVIGVVFAALLILWRATVWYGDVQEARPAIAAEVHQ